MGTLKTQKNLEYLLADNTAKEISAADVRTIVTSNYQPQMIYAGYGTDNGTSGNYSIRTMYYNPSFFSDQAITTTSTTGCWKIDNVGAGITDNTYPNQTLTPPSTYDGFGAGSLPWSDFGGEAFGAVFDVTVSSGIVTSVSLVSGGSGWIGHRAGADAAESQGMIGEFSLPGATTQPKLEFLGPLQVQSDTGDVNIISMSVNNTLQGTQKNHIGMNTLAIVSCASDADPNSQQIYLSNQNEIRLEDDGRNHYFSLWRMPQWQSFS